MHENAPDTERDQRLADLFDRACRLPVPERAAFLSEHCSDDPHLASELSTLLAHDREETQPHLRSPLASATTPPERVGPYVVVRQLGTGGMGDVFLALQEEPVRRLVALKLIKPGLDTKELVARFEAERQVLAWLDHPNIAKVLDAGSTASGRPFFVMEHVPGDKVTDYCRSKALAPKARVELLLLVCKGVHHAHQRGVLHRDLKPSNVLVAEVDGAPLPKIIDFGVAKATLDAELRTPATIAGELLGTPEYMSPEQAAGHMPPDVRADVYALGVLLYELLAGRRPIEWAQGETRDALLRRVAEEEPRPPSAFGTGTGAAMRGPARELDWIVAKALAKSAARRYQSVQDLARDLEAWLAGAAISAGPPTLSYRFAKLVRRHSAALLAASAVLLALCAGLVIALWQYTVAKARAAEAEHALLQLKRLADDRLADTLWQEAERSLWPLVPSRIAALERWLGRCADLERNLPLHRADLRAVEAALAGAGPQARNDELDWRRDVLQRVVARTEKLLDDAARNGRKALAQRLERARTLRDLQSAEAAAWLAARAAIADRARCPAYDGRVELGEHEDLVPLGQNAATGLWEFWHAPSGARPQWSDAGGVATARAEDGIVLVLLPGGRFWMGAESAEGAAHRDELAHPFEAPAHVVRLAPFLLAKFELTQAQLERWTGSNGSWFARERMLEARERIHVGPTNPAEQISWDFAAALATQMGMVLPTEAQWEYACRAGTRTRFFWGNDEARMPLFANAADEASRDYFTKDTETVPGADDGHAVHAPAGSFRPNAFGLYDMIGNVAEWCRDWIGPYSLPVEAGTGERKSEGEARRLRTVRGGHYSLRARDCRCSARGEAVTREHKWAIGMRVSRLAL